MDRQGRRQAILQGGDPAKAAALMIEAVDSANPPARLMMGKDAFDLYDRLISARHKEFDEWRMRGEATAFDDARMIRIGGANAA